VAGERKHIPAKVKRTVFSKANHRCEKCGSAHALQIDHRMPVCHGGGNTLPNLRVLCRTCNQREAIKKIGDEQMRLYLQ
jgi:5-methylcytosine-specific restriction endonuclease McrA